MGDHHLYWKHHKFGIKSTIVRPTQINPMLCWLLYHSIAWLFNKDILFMGDHNPQHSASYNPLQSPTNRGLATTQLSFADW